MLILPCLMPMLLFMNVLIKFAQSPTCYILDFMFAIKTCQDDLYQLYVDLVFSFHGKEFNL